MSCHQESYLCLQKGTQWTFYTTGHSLGGFLATVVAIEIGQEIEKCVPSTTFCLKAQLLR
jgi:hypothetical protein